MRVVDNVGFNVKKQDIPGGGSSGGNAQPLATPDWNQNDEKAADYIKNRPFYKKETFTETELLNNTFSFEYDERTMTYQNTNIRIRMVEGETYIVVLDGVEYETVCQLYMGMAGYEYIGAVEFLDGSGTAIMPFAYAHMGGSNTVFITSLAGETHDIIIKKITSGYDYVKLPEYYLPDERIILKSTTADSTKKFAITVDDSGTLTATEV